MVLEHARLVSHNCLDDFHVGFELTIGHLLAIEDGARLGATEIELYSDANLATMCEACNIGLRHGPRSLTPRTYAVIIWRLTQAELGRAPPAPKPPPTPPESRPA